MKNEFSRDRSCLPLIQRSSSLQGSGSSLTFPSTLGTGSGAGGFGTSSAGPPPGPPFRGTTTFPSQGGFASGLANVSRETEGLFVPGMSCVVLFALWAVVVGVVG